ncbi:MAG TPA: MerR family transcriptional regulator [Solirubrobacteraceae bacterium]
MTPTAAWEAADPVDEETSRGVYSIGAVSTMVGVPQATLRTWEARYGGISPERTGSGHRLYTREQVARLRFVVSQTRRGMTAADAHRSLAERVLRAAPRDAGARPRVLILVAERDRYSAELIEFLLDTQGFQVELALDVDEARTKFEDAGPDLVVIELLVGGGAGLDLCRRLRERSATPLLTVSPLEVPDRALEAGADAFLPKPLGHLQFISAVKDLLGLSAMLSRGD